MFFNKIDKDKKIELQQKEIERLLFENQNLVTQLELLQSSIDKEHNKAEVEYEKARQLAYSLEVAKKEYELLLMDAKKCRNIYLEKIGEVRELQKQYSKEYKKVQKEHQKIK